MLSAGSRQAFVCLCFDFSNVTTGRPVQSPIRNGSTHLPCPQSSCRVGSPGFWLGARQGFSFEGVARFFFFFSFTQI